MKQMATKNIQFQQNMGATIQDLQTLIGQLATTINLLQQQGSSNIPAQQIINPKGNVSVITLRSGRELPKPTDVGAKIDDSAKTDYAPKQIPLALPSRSICAKKVELDSNLLKTFRRVEVNIPLLDAIKHIPKYTKFLKDLCTRKRKLKGNKQVKLGRNFSALIQSKSVFAIPPSPLPQKCKVLALLLSLIPLKIALLQMSCLTLDSQLMSCPHQFTDHYIFMI